MTRALPNCAGCGTPLRKAKGFALYKYQGLDRKPNFGWCEACNWGDDDLEFRRLNPGGENAPGDTSSQATRRALRVLDRVIAAIEARGPGRVTWSMPKP
jgi:hypothetical protein